MSPTTNGKAPAVASTTTGAQKSSPAHRTSSGNIITPAMARPANLIKPEISWKTEKRWSDRFLPEVKAIIGAQLIAEPPIEEDAQRNTDLIVLKLNAVRIAVRVRRHSYLASYGDEFTIRSGRPSGAKVELTKIIEGWGDYLLYGFADQADASLFAWTLADLNVFRLSYQRKTASLPRGIVPGEMSRNTDRSSSFTSFKWSDFPTGLVVARGGEHFGKWTP